MITAKHLKKWPGRIITPLRYFFEDSRSVGILLIFSTLLSLFLTNFPGGSWYPNLWHQQIPALNNLLPDTPGAWINDFLMAFFFLMAGMEIKRELMEGELSALKKAVLPFGAALGGMVVPALIFILINARTAFMHGWGIPTATDIAFSIGVASLFGKRIPVGLKILLMALAIIDDLGAIVVIALFYGSAVRLKFLALSALVYGALWACNLRKVKFGLLQVVLSLSLWYTIFNSGIEAGIAGVLVAFALPLEVVPRIATALHKPVNFLILPLFALANTAILIPTNMTALAFSSTISIGVMLGLVAGKPIGIFLFSRLMVWAGIAKLPSGVKWNQLLGMGMLAGIGFTMSIFTTTLAFQDNASRDLAKLAILLAMVGSVVVSAFYFSWLGKKSVFEIPAGESRQLVPESAALG